MKPNGAPLIEIWKGEELIFHDEDVDCIVWLGKMLRDQCIRWSLHNAFLNAWEGKIPTEVWLDVIREGIEITAVLIEGMSPGHPWRLRMEAKAADLSAALRPHLDWIEKRMARAAS
jgi:hypothetical protein